MNITEQRPAKENLEGVQTLTLKAPKKNDTKNVTKTLVQYNELMKEFKGTGKLWEDPYFPADNNSLFTFPGHNATRTWKRPMEINADAVLIFRGPNRKDVKISVNADFERSRFLSALISITDYEPLFKNVVPDGQDFDFNYIGAFRFRFWKFGEWREIIVDDRLPLLEDKLEFTFSNTKFEFWAALVEKAYAKMYGTYEEIMKISQSDAMQDLTAGICETIDLTMVSPSFYTDMFKFWKQSSLQCCIMEKPGKPSGIQGFQSHNIIKLVMLNRVDGGVEKIIRIRNPNGTDEHNTGSWHDNSDYWFKFISPEDQKTYNTVAVDGEFWISYENFREFFTHLIVCHLGPQSVEDGINDQLRWSIDLHEGAWVKNVNSGGSRKNLNLYSTNPQYLVNLLDKDIDDENDNATLIVSLIQMDWTRMSFEYSDIGYDIYKLKEPPIGLLDEKFFKSNDPIIENTVYTNKSVISSSHTFGVGQYVIVPSKSDVSQDGKFFLRIGSRKLTTMVIDEAIGRTVLPEKMEKRLLKTSSDNLGKELEVIFEKVTSSTGFIDAGQLKNILNAILTKDSQCVNMKVFKEFTSDHCQRMIALYDENRNGQMEFPEFVSLMNNFRIWKTTFKEFDVNDDGVFNSSEYRKALKHCGLCVSNEVFRIIVCRYADPVTGQIKFEDFVMSCLRLTDSFNTVEKLAMETYSVEIFNPYECLEHMIAM